MSDNAWDKTKKFFETKSIPRDLVIHALIVIGFLLPVWIVASKCESDAQKFADAWRSDLLPFTCLADGKQDLTIPSGFSVKQEGDNEATVMSADQGKRLTGQFREVQGRMNHHFNLLAKFYKNYFATIIMAGILAAVAAIALLFITSDGWQHSSPYARTIFLVATVSATFCAAFPSIFQHQQNIDDNRRLYMEYVSLANEMCTYVSTGLDADGKSIYPIDFTHNVDVKLGRLNKIAVGFDFSKIPDFSTALKQGTNPAPDSGGKSSSPASTKARPSPKQ